MLTFFTEIWFYYGVKVDRGDHHNQLNQYNIKKHLFCLDKRA